MLKALGNESDEYEPPEATHPSTSGPVATDSLPLRPSSPVAGREVSELPPTSTSKELHPVSEPHVQDPATLTSLQSDADRGPAGASFFTPYETPLKNFRAYRLHPEYSNNVRDGFRSITYSNRILPNEMFCPTELMGKACEDSTCDFQHFRDVKIPGAWIGVTGPTSSLFLIIDLKLVFSFQFSWLTTLLLTNR